jgi:hypothetical protein
MVDPGGLETVRDYLECIDLGQVNKRSLPEVLNQWTNTLGRKHARGSKHGIGWGPARKSLNLFLRDVTYNYMTRKEYHLDSHEKELEVPLDGKVMKAIRGESKKTANLENVAVKNLTKKISDKYQKVAQAIANSKGVSRVNLDLEWW